MSCVLYPVSHAQTCREVVREASGRVVQTIERQKQAGGTERAVVRDASGRIPRRPRREAVGARHSVTPVAGSAAQP